MKWDVLKWCMATFLRFCWLPPSIREARWHRSSVRPTLHLKSFVLLV